MRVAVLTSSRADYSIYLPLLKALKEDPFFNLQIIAFGTHLSHFHGHTIDQILADGFNVDYRIETVVASDTPNGISTSMAITLMKFAEFWDNHKNNFDIVLCLGDRYEMFAAVSAAIPYQISFAHFHGGEETLGAIDNVFRNSITHASRYHFVSCETHAQKVKQLSNSTENIFNVGALSLDNIRALNVYSIEEFFQKFCIDLRHPSILVTIHPETVEPGKNVLNAEVVSAALLALEDYQILLTLPNADTCGNSMRRRFLSLPAESDNRIVCFENLGTKGYFTAMTYCSFMMGNTSSGIIEAASFNKWVINIGNRQKGRQHSDNVLSVSFKKEDILSMVERIEQNPVYAGTNIYFKENAAMNICSILKGLI